MRPRLGKQNTLGQDRWTVSGQPSTWAVAVKPNSGEPCEIDVPTAASFHWDGEIPWVRRCLVSSAGGILPERPYFVITTEQKPHKQPPAMGIQKDNGVTDDDGDNSGNHALSIREKIGDLAQFSRLDMQSAPFFIIWHFSNYMDGSLELNVGRHFPGKWGSKRQGQRQLGGRGSEAAHNERQLCELRLWDNHGWGRKRKWDSIMSLWKITLHW